MSGFPRSELVQDIAQRVKQEGGLLVANEITTGMGRTGKWFGFQHYDFQPDIVSIGKGLGNGYPVSAIAMKRDVAEKLENSGFHYVQSHQNDPLGCAIAKEVIATFREENWVERGNASWDVFSRRIEASLKGNTILSKKRAAGACCLRWNSIRMKGSRLKRPIMRSWRGAFWWDTVLRAISCALTLR